MISFETLKYKNFLSTGNKFIEINLNKHTTTLISGKNGSGKSTFLDALTYSLYGKPFRKINKPQLINNINKSELLTEITFTTNNKKYKIVRGMKPVVFEIYEDGKLIDQEAKSLDYQDYLEKNILKLNYKAFTQIVVVGHATYMPFMKLVPNDRRIIVENLLDIDIFSKMNGLLKQKISETKEMINDISYKQDLVKEKIKIHKDTLENSNTVIDTKIQKLKDEIDQTNSLLRSKKKELDNVRNAISSLEVNSSRLKELKEKLSKISEYQIVIKNKIKVTQKELDFFQKNNNCSLCHQDIKEDFKEKHISAKELEAQKYQNAIQESSSKIESMKNELNSIISTMDIHKKKQEELNVLEVQLEFYTKEITRLNGEVDSLLNQKKNDYNKIEADYESAKAELDDLVKKRDRLIEEQHLNSIAGVILKDDGIKTKIIKSYLPQMNKTINKYLNLMDFFINFHLTENFEETIKIANRENFSYNSFSEGEKLRIDLAILFTWRDLAKTKNSANTNILIFDEVFDSSLDSNGVDDFLRIINSFGNNSNIFVISHKDDLIADRFETHLKFEKKNGFSRIN